MHRYLSILKILQNARAIKQKIFSICSDWKSLSTFLMIWGVTGCLLWASFSLQAAHGVSSACNKNCRVNLCCEKMGGILYCDRLSARYVCHNGFYSTCYCTRHAVMDLQHIEGCCLWQGGVLKTTRTGVVICRDGTFSPICTIATSTFY